MSCGRFLVMASKTAAALLVVVRSLPSAGACSCMDTGATPAEAAAFTTGSEHLHTELVFVGRVLDEVSYGISDDNEGAPYEFRSWQNVTFSLEEILFHRDADGALPPNVLVGDNGTRTVATSTETTCCLCGQGGFAVGKARHLVVLDSGLGLSACNVNCRLAEGSFCEDVAEALRSAPSNSGQGVLRAGSAMRSLWNHISVAVIVIAVVHMIL